MTHRNKTMGTIFIKEHYPDGGKRKVAIRCAVQDVPAALKTLSRGAQPRTRWKVPPGLLWEWIRLVLSLAFSGIPALLS